MALNLFDQLNSSKFVKLFLVDLQNLALKEEVVVHQLCCVLIKLFEPVFLHLTLVDHLLLFCVNILYPALRSDRLVLPLC